MAKYIRKYKGPSGKWVYVYKNKSTKYISEVPPTKALLARKRLKTGLKIAALTLGGTGIVLGSFLKAQRISDRRFNENLNRRNKERESYWDKLKGGIKIKENMIKDGLENRFRPY